MLGKLLDLFRGKPTPETRISHREKRRSSNPEQREISKPDLLDVLPEARAAVDELAVGQLDRIRALVASTRGSWGDRGLCTELFRNASIPSLEHWCRQEPQNPDAWLMSGMARISWAWDARSSNRAKQVREAQWVAFEARLALAQKDLQKAVALYPEDPTPWAGLIWIHRGGGSGYQPVYDLFAEGIGRDPVNFLVHKNAILALTQQWHGSHERMMAQAREAASLAAPDNDLAGLLAYGHFYGQFYLSNFDNDKAATKAYRTDPANRKEVAALFDRVAAARQGGPLPLRSVPSWNHFAYWFRLTEDRARLAHCLELVAGRYSFELWGSCNVSPNSVLAEVKAFAGI